MLAATLPLLDKLSDLISVKIGTERWVASIVAIALVTIAANYALHLLLRQALYASEDWPSAWPRRTGCRTSSVA